MFFSEATEQGQELQQHLSTQLADVESKLVVTRCQPVLVALLGMDPFGISCFVVLDML
jgi:hypothetical protein